MPRVPTVRQSDVNKAVRALTEAGLGVASVVIRPGGEVIITPGEPAPPAAALPAAPPAGKPVNLDSWREQQRERRAAQGR